MDKTQKVAIAGQKSETHIMTKTKVKGNIEKTQDMNWILALQEGKTTAGPRDLQNGNQEQAGEEEEEEEEGKQIMES